MATPRFMQPGSAAARRNRALVPALIAAGSLLVWGCATPPEKTDDGQYKEYRTGSNIPVRDRNAKSDTKVYDPSSVQDAVRGTTPSAPAGLRGG